MSKKGGGNPLFSDPSFVNFFDKLMLIKYSVKNIAKEEHLSSLSGDEAAFKFNNAKADLDAIMINAHNAQVRGVPFTDIKWEVEKTDLLMKRMVAIYKYNNDDFERKTNLYLSLKKLINHKAMFDKSCKAALSQIEKRFHAIKDDMSPGSSMTFSRSSSSSIDGGKSTKKPLRAQSNARLMR